MTSLEASVREADFITDRDTYIATVKSAVRNHLSALDAGVTFEDTGYFNHVAVPDFQLHWNDGTPSRPLFLRRSIQEIQAWQDLDHFGTARCMVMSLSEPVDAASVDRTQSQTLSRPDSQLLLADGRAVEEFEATPDPSDDADAVEANRRMSAAFPMKDLVAGQVMRTGRGLINQESAIALTRVGGDLPSLVERFFSPAGATVLSETASLVSAATDESRSVAAQNRPLTALQARRLLPWLLTAPEVREDPGFWESLASRLTLAVLEEVSDALDRLDMTRLADFGRLSWRAKRAYLGINVDPDEEELVAWRMQDGILNHIDHGRAIRFCTDGRALRKGRDSVSSATWPRVQANLGDDVSLATISLRGIDRRIRLEGERPESLTRDIEKVIESIDTNLFVDEVSVLVPSGGEDSPSRVDVDLGAALAVSEPATTLKPLDELLTGLMRMP